MRVRASLILAAVPLLAVTAAEASPPPFPDWAQQAVAAPVPEHSNDAKAVVLLEDKLLTVQSDGRAVELT